MQVEITAADIRTIEQLRNEMSEHEFINLKETKALLNRIYDRLGKEPRKRKPKQDLVALMMRNRRTI